MAEQFGQDSFDYLNVLAFRPWYFIWEILEEVMSLWEFNKMIESRMPWYTPFLLIVLGIVLLIWGGKFK